jgi:probable phosphomutase (TIGR03848 family)
VTLLLLVRHALTDVTGRRLSGSTPGIHLSEQGRVQAKDAAERLAPLRLAAIYTSPLERCVETAEAIAESRGLAVDRLAALEEVGYGGWTGKSFAQLTRTALWKRVQHAPSSVRFPGGETLTEAQLRAVTALEAVAARHPKAAVAVVSHADIIRLSLAHFAGVHLDLFQRIIVSPASVSAVLLGDRIPRILRMNDTGTLADLATRARRTEGTRARPARPRDGSGP